MDQDQSKHSSVASNSSSLSTGVLNEAVVMGITRTNASPQVMRVESMKSHASLIQRSNSLHSSNSIKRTLSQLTKNRLRGRNKNNSIGGSGDGEALSRSMSAGMASISPTTTSEDMSRRLELTIDHDEFVQDLSTLGSFLDGQDKEMNTGYIMNNRDSNNSNYYSDSDTERETVYMYTPAVIVTGPSVRSSAQSTESMSLGASRRSGPSVPSMVLESRPFQSMSSSSGSTPIGYYYQHPSSHAPSNSIPKPGCTPDHGYPLTATTKSPSLPNSLQNPPSSSPYSTNGMETVVESHSAPTTALVSLLASTSNSNDNNNYNNTNAVMSNSASNYPNSSNANLPPKISTGPTPAMFTFSSSTVHPLSSSSSTSFYSFKSLPGPSPVSAGPSPVTPLGYGFVPSSSGSGTTIHGGGGVGGHFNGSPMGNTTTRDSTLSTLSSIDARSTTTRGDGEEIMIFWDGHRGSRSSSTMQ
ncbi:hypothetical protein EMPS_08306 [Entomortierella parvispora]|uniref:Uncharacterized protein n=1 Tax=Entomortierella parvispora TaxID=205924 RepID=A0A9P3HGH5_9FUNG|nr:hypothetical protein EMPS_08306 [Entomortierella parvispora]